MCYEMMTIIGLRNRSTVFVVELEGARTRGTPKRTWKEVVEGDMKRLTINKKMH